MLTVVADRPTQIEQAGADTDVARHLFASVFCLLTAESP